MPKGPDLLSATSAARPTVARMRNLLANFEADDFPISKINRTNNQMSTKLTEKLKVSMVWLVEIL